MISQYFEAFECDVAHGTFIATANELHGMFPPLLLPPLLSSLLSLPHPEKRQGPFYYRNISGDEFIFITILNKFQKLAAGENYSHYSFI